MEHILKQCRFENGEYSSTAVNKLLESIDDKKEFIRIKGLREELKVVVVAALVYGETIKQQENTSDDSKK